MRLKAIHPVKLRENYEIKEDVVRIDFPMLYHFFILSSNSDAL